MLLHITCCYCKADKPYFFTSIHINNLFIDISRWHFDRWPWIWMPCNVIKRTNGKIKLLFFFSPRFFYILLLVRKRQIKVGERKGERKRKKNWIKKKEKTCLIYYLRQFKKKTIACQIQHIHSTFLLLFHGCRRTEGRDI